jgi:threonylcarbamoyladenosine tRNA methylthiotransferase MtaB
MRDLASKAGQGNAIIVNTCAVTAEAERQARQAIRKAHRDNPGARIIVTGCAAETSAARFAAMAEVDEILPNAAKRDPARFGARLLPDPLPLKPALSGSDHARAFVEVQNGCDHDCTFCVTTLARGPSRSIPAGAIIDAIKARVEAGQKEVILTGVDLTSYGPDLPGSPTLGLLVERILTHVPALERLRLSSQLKVTKALPTHSCSRWSSRSSPAEFFVP